ncbi:MAG: rRNA maturation RNase YbeY [Anaerolineales bacterium]|nr:rRNA maturation RNase YbeY [Anaerolineales bacterium]
MNNFAIDIQFDIEINEKNLERHLIAAAVATLQQQRVKKPATLTVLLTDDQQLRVLNRDYRGFDETTDVLSFTDGTELPEMGLYLGDIAISVPQAQRQADQQGHPLLDELRLLTVHGVLHLLGHDHAEPEEKERMWSAQEIVLNQLKQ